MRAVSAVTDRLDSWGGGYRLARAIREVLPAHSLAEDNEVNQRLALRLLQKAGHDVEVVANGRDAVALALQMPFDLILMDVQMPEMDGFEATARVREVEQQSGQEPRLIVAMTAHAMAGDRERCLEAGMDDCGLAEEIAALP